MKQQQEKTKTLIQGVMFGNSTFKIEIYEDENTTSAIIEDFYNTVVERGFFNEDGWNSILITINGTSVNILDSSKILGYKIS